LSQVGEVAKTILSGLAGVLLMWHLAGLSKRLASGRGGRSVAKRQKKSEGVSFRNEPIDPH
jgi:hypothetical protein